MLFVLLSALVFGLAMWMVRRHTARQYFRYGYLAACGDYSIDPPAGDSPPVDLPTAYKASEAWKNFCTLHSYASVAARAAIDRAEAERERLRR